MSKLRDAFSEVYRSGGWRNIDQLIDELDGYGAYDELDLSEAVRQYKKSITRREIKEWTDETGHPVVASIVLRNPATGKDERVYMSELLFDVEQYRQVVDYHVSRSNYFRRQAVSYAERAQGRYGVQIPLAFETSEAAS